LSNEKLEKIVKYFQEIFSTIFHLHQNHIHGQRVIGHALFLEFIAKKGWGEVNIQGKILSSNSELQQVQC